MDLALQICADSEFQCLAANENSPDYFVEMLAKYSLHKIIYVIKAAHITPTCLRLVCLCNERILYPMDFSLHRKRGIMHFYSFHKKLKSSISRKMSSFFFYFLFPKKNMSETKTKTTNCTKNHSNFPLHLGILFIIQTNS